MKPHPDAISIFNKIKKESGLTDDKLQALGFTIQSLDEAYRYCLDNKMSKKAAKETIYKLWKDQAIPKLLASVQDMILNGFYLEGNAWCHKDSEVEVTVEELKSMSFEEVKKRVF